MDEIKIKEIFKQLEMSKEALEHNIESNYKTSTEILARIQTIQYLVYKELKE